jgi:hypothetical protein
MREMMKLLRTANFMLLMRLGSMLWTSRGVMTALATSKRSVCERLSTTESIATFSYVAGDRTPCRRSVAAFVTFVSTLMA